jgi:holo-[acyl-carrier protein] synthase
MSGGSGQAGPEPAAQQAAALEKTVQASLGARCAVGIDLVDIDEVERSIDTFGDAYLDRLFTAHERASCRGSARTRAASFAARFAAKEAALKVLAPTGEQPEWRSIEVVRLAHGACELHLHGTAAALADAAGLSSFSVSLTHDANLAAAVVVGERRAAGKGIAQATAEGEQNGKPGQPVTGRRVAHPPGAPRAQERQGDR